MLNRCPIATALLVSLFVCLSRMAIAADLTVTVTGLISDNGDVHIAVYDRADAFPKSDGMVVEVKPKPKGGSAQWQFKNLPPGRYAVAVFHDANGNDEFDQGIFGVPLEDFGFSSGARAFLGPPSFDDAAFVLLEQGSTITIDLGNKNGDGK